MKKQLFWPLLCSTVFTVSSSLFPLDIIELHRNNSTGRPIYLSKVVTVTGIVTVPSGLLSTTSLEIFIQDSTAGIHVYSAHGDLAYLALGDLVTVTGTISILNGGMTYIREPSALSVLGDNQPLPQPLLLTCTELAGSFLPDLSEPNESRLIRMENIQVTRTGGGIYTIRDATGTSLLEIDPDAGLPDLPDGFFDLTGILRQYDPSIRPPQKAGYRIMPRFHQDILSRGAPLLVKPLQEAAIFAHAVEVTWRTDRPATSLVRFGKSSSYELCAAGDSALVTDHSVRIEGLDPSALYRARAWSSDITGTMITDSLLFMTASSRSSGSIEVFFTQSVDASKAWREVANGNTDLSKIIVERINQAKFSLDVHYYSFTHADIALALVNAKRRGVSVRFIADNQANTANNDRIQWLKEAGIPVIDDLFGLNDSTAASHNKIVIVDCRDMSSGLDDYLWVGSSNASLAGASKNGENMLLIQDESLCAAYTIEFNEMWGSETEVPNPALSRFGTRKRDNTPHRFNVGGRWIEQYMSPSDNTESKLISAIQSADHSLYFCILAYTQNTVLNAMRNQYLQRPGLSIRGVFDRSSVSSDYSVYEQMAGLGANSWSPPADVHLDILNADLHHKYLIVDANYADSDPLVVTGSHNWSNAANTQNDENTLIIHDRNIANLYSQEFSARYHESGGTGEITAHLAQRSATRQQPEELDLIQNYPNPFNDRTVVSIHETEDHQDVQILAIYSATGAEVARMQLPHPQSGRHELMWEARDESGRPLPSGIYFAKTVSPSSRAAKMILIR